MWKELFRLNKSDRKVVILLLLLAAIALFVMQLAEDESPEPVAAEADSTALAPLHGLSSSPAIVYDTPSHRRVERFAFDPNTADSTQLLRLGLEPWMVRNIYKYRASGGVYRKKEDFARLYGLTVKQYRELEPYIQISPDYLPASTLVKAESHERDTLRYPQKLHAGETIDLATADTTALRRVPGIGSYFARRIVEYGERLGGYVNTGQLQEIDGFPVEALPFFTLSPSDTRKLNVNRLSLNELKHHPYINYYQAKAIVDYRRLHGRIDNLDQLRLLNDFPTEAIVRLKPYVEY